MPTTLEAREALLAHMLEGAELPKFATKIERGFEIKFDNIQLKTDESGPGATILFKFGELAVFELRHETFRQGDWLDLAGFNGAVPITVTFG